MPTLDEEDVEKIADAVVNTAANMPKKGKFSKALIVFSVDTLTVEQITGIITAGGALVAYVLAEGYVDGRREKDKQTESND